MSEPTTEAGRRLLADAEYEDDGEWVVACYEVALPERILVIEQEARADLAARISRRVETDLAAWLTARERGIVTKSVLAGIAEEASDDRRA